MSDSGKRLFAVMLLCVATRCTCHIDTVIRPVRAEMAFDNPNEFNFVILYDVGIKWEYCCGSQETRHAN